MNKKRMKIYVGSPDVHCKKCGNTTYCIEFGGAPLWKPTITCLRCNWVRNAKEVADELRKEL